MTDTKSLRTEAEYAIKAGLYVTYRAMTEAADTIDTLRAENERLRACFDWANGAAEEGWLPAQEVRKLRAQLAEAQKNAERYDFLAGFGVTAHSPRWAHWRIERWTKDGWSPIYGNLMSAAIDAAKGDSNG